MLSINLLNKLQAQFTLERANETFYRMLASAAAAANRPGAQRFFEKNANEEGMHARRIGEYLIDRNERPRFAALGEVASVDAANYVGMFQAALEREHVTTLALRELWEMADDVEKDAQTAAFLMLKDDDFPGFLAEQTRSERELVDVLLKIKRLSEDGLEVFDSGLGDEALGS